jgi:hypothetical protein
VSGPLHRSRLVWEFVRQQRGRLWLEIPSGLRTGVESRGVSVAALETARATELLSRQLPGTEPARPPGAVSDASPPHTGLSFWEQAEQFPLYLYYVIINCSLCSRFCQIEKLVAEL